MSSEPPAPNQPENADDDILTEDFLPDDAAVFTIQPAGVTPPAPSATTAPDAQPASEQQPEETLAENTIPSSQQVFITRPFDPVEHNAKTRRILAFTSLGVLVLFYGATFTCFVIDLITLEELTSIIAVFSGLQTLAAAAFGYYFAKDN